MKGLIAQTALRIAEKCACGLSVDEMFVVKDAAWNVLNEMFTETDIELHYGHGPVRCLVPHKLAEPTLADVARDLVGWFRGSDGCWIRNYGDEVAKRIDVLYAALKREKGK